MFNLCESNRLYRKRDSISQRGIHVCKRKGGLSPGCEQGVIVMKCLTALLNYLTVGRERDASCNGQAVGSWCSPEPGAGRAVTGETRWSAVCTEAERRAGVAFIFYLFDIIGKLLKNIRSGLAWHEYFIVRGKRSPGSIPKTTGFQGGCDHVNTRSNSDPDVKSFILPAYPVTKEDAC